LVTAVTINDDGKPGGGPEPKWLKGSNHDNARQAKKHETRLASRLGGFRYTASGSKQFSRYTNAAANPRETDKGDIATPKFHFEHKFTRAKSLSLQLEWLVRVRDGAKIRLKDPGLIFTFQNQQGQVLEEWVSMPLDVFERLMSKSEGNDA
jgi:hypothetical protein